MPKNELMLPTWPHRVARSGSDGADVFPVALPLMITASAGGGIKTPSIATMTVRQSHGPFERWPCRDTSWKGAMGKKEESVRVGGGIDDE